MGINFRRPDPPDIIKHLDSLEKERIENYEPGPSLSAEDKEGLFQRIPALRQLAADLDAAIDEEDFDLDDSQIWTWVYYKLYPWYPSRLLQVASVAVAYYTIRAIIRAVRARYTLTQIVSTIVVTETIIVPAMAIIIPALVTIYLLLRKRGQTLFDAVTRTMVMFTASSFALLPVAAINSTGNVTLALIYGIFVRIPMMTMSLWYWGDLRREVNLPTSHLERFVQLWRWFTTVFVIFAGSVIRLIAVTGIFPFSKLLRSRAEGIRIHLGKKFPIALSLCNDPRGLFFGASLTMIAITLYILYLFIYATNFGQIRKHRKCESWLSRTFIRYGVFLPNVHPDATYYRISATEKTSSYIPSRAMLLRHEDSVFEVDSSFLSSEAIMPIFSYLEKEEEILAKDGATEWSKPRDQEVPLSGKMTAGKRDLNALLNWAQPLRPEEANMTFEEYFETLQEDEYQYDPESGNWVIDKKILGDLPANSIDQKDELPKNSPSDDAMIELSMPEIPVDDATIIEFATSPEFQPYLKRYIEELEENQDDPDEPTDTVYA